MSDIVGQEMIKAINQNDLIEHLDISNNLMHLRFIEYVENKCKRNRVQNYKLQVPRYQSELNTLADITGNYEKVQQRFKKMEIKSRQLTL